MQLHLQDFVNGHFTLVVVLNLLQLHTKTPIKEIRDGYIEVWNTGIALGKGSKGIGKD
jgi:hypothetical protein